MKLVLVTLALLLAGCASEPATPDSESDSSEGSSTNDLPPEPATIEVDIASFAFSDGDLTIQVGDSVRWTNQDGAAHTVDSTDGGPLASGTLRTGDDYTFVFEEAGEYAYKCNFHSSMTGIIRVVAPS